MDALPGARDIRLLVVDIDGTCMDAAGDVSVGVRRALRRARDAGLSLAVATGRTHQTALDFHALTGSTLPLISYDGALLKARAATGFERRWPLAPDPTQAVLDLLRRRAWREHIVAYVHVAGEIVATQISATAQALAARRGLRIERVDSLAPYVTGGVDHVSLIAHEAKPLYEFRAALREDPSAPELRFGVPVPTRNVDGGLLLSLSPARADKGRALAYLAQTMLGLERRQVAAIGDGLNDVGMLEYAGIGIAMGQARDAVKAAADAVAPDIESDGVAAAIEGLVSGA